MKKLFAAALIAFVPLSGPAYSQGTTYVPMPSGFDFPADEKTLLALQKNGDVSGMRLHGWMVFAGMTQPARANDPASEAIWETWYRGTDVFRIGAAPQGVRPIRRQFSAPLQFHTSGFKPQAVGKSLAAFTLFNKQTLEHVQTNNLQRSATLSKINSSWPAGTAPADRKVKDFDREAMSLKAAWMLVKEKGMTPLPVWDEQARVPVAPAQDTDTWKRQVLVDPSRDSIPATEMKDGSRVVPLKSFYHFKVTAAQVPVLQKVVGPLSAGDYLVLVAMHYTTKEIPNWVWATFWWHDCPDEGPFGANRPDASKLRAPWRNYKMDVAYDMDTPKESDGTANAVFNPWLEARFEDGVNSNCMTCHQKAVWDPKAKKGVPDFDPVTRGSRAVSDPLFVRGTKVDFMWSLLMEGNKP